MHDIFQRFVDRLVAQPDTPALGEALTEMLAFLDVESFAYLLIPSAVHVAARLISNYPPGWTSHYLANRYQTVDPVILEAGRAPASFAWDADMNRHLRPESHAEFFEEAARFGIRRGLTIPIHDGRPHVAALTIAADTGRPKFDRAIERYEPALQLIATLFHRAARRTLIADRIVDGVALSPREYECLGWVAKGKTGWEISAILGVSHRTVTFHLENAKQKLGVYSIAEAVARFVAANAQL